MSVIISGEHFLPQCTGVCSINRTRGYVTNGVIMTGENISILLKNMEDEYPETRKDVKIWIEDHFLGTWALLPDSYSEINFYPNCDEQRSLRIDKNTVITITFFSGMSTDVTRFLEPEEVLKTSTFTYLITTIDHLVGIPNVFSASNLDGANACYV